MELKSTHFAEDTNTRFSFAAAEFGEFADSRERLDSILDFHNDSRSFEARFKYETEELETQTMKNPVSVEQAFSGFGLLLGLFPPLSFFAAIAIDMPRSSDKLGLFTFFLFVNITTMLVGFFSGKKIGKYISKIEEYDWTPMIILSALIGLLWGLITGGIGGAVIFLVGGIFGALIGGAVGFAALPVFTFFHRLLKKGEFIENRQFLPIAFGITFTICAFILGF